MLVQGRRIVAIITHRDVPALVDALPPFRTSLRSEPLYMPSDNAVTNPNVLRSLRRILGTIRNFIQGLL